MVRGVSFYMGNFPNEFQFHLHIASHDVKFADFKKTYYAYMGSILILTMFAYCIQLLTSRSRKMLTEKQLQNPRRSSDRRRFDYDAEHKEVRVSLADEDCLDMEAAAATAAVVERKKSMSGRMSMKSSAAANATSSTLTTLCRLVDDPATTGDLDSQRDSTILYKQS